MKAKIILKQDCGNAPRKKFLSELNASIANADMDGVAEKINNDIIWEVLNGLKVSGKDRFLEKLKTWNLWKVKELHIDNIITHGDTSVNGKVISMDDNQIAFCHIFTFASAGSSKVKRILTFMTDLKTK